MKRRIALSLAHNKDSKPWTLSCGQSLFFPSLLCKEFVQHEGMVVTRFHHSWSWSIKLVQFHTGMVWPGIKMIQTEYRLVSVGVSVGPSYFLQKHAKARFKHAWAVWKAPQKAHKKEVKPIWNWWPLFIWIWITGYRFWGVLYRLCRFHELLQSSRQLLATLFIQ